MTKTQALRKLDAELDEIDTGGFGVGLTMYCGVPLKEFTKEELILIITLMANKMVRK